MAGSRLLPLLLVTLVLPPKPPGKSSILAFTGIVFTLLWENRATDLPTDYSPTSSEPTLFTTPHTAAISVVHQTSLLSETSSTTRLSLPSAEASSTDSPSSGTSPITPFNSPSSGENTITHPGRSSSGTSTAIFLSPSSAETSSATHLSLSSADPRTASTSPQPGTVTPPIAGSPSPQLSSTSQFTHPTSSSMTAGWTPVLPSHGPSSGDSEVPTSYRNPGVVVAICLLVSVLLIGSVVMAVRSCRQDASEFHKLDEVSLRSMSRRSSFTHRPPE